MEFQHGAILALGYVGRHCLLYDLSKSNGEDSTRTLEEDTEELAAKRLRSTDCIMEALTKLGRTSVVHYYWYVDSNYVLTCVIILSRVIK